VTIAGIVGSFHEEVKVEDVSDDDDDRIVAMIILIVSTATQSNHGDCFSPDNMSATNLLKILAVWLNTNLLTMLCN